VQIDFSLSARSSLSGHLLPPWATRKICADERCEKPVERTRRVAEENDGDLLPIVDGLLDEMRVGLPL
jgi:hypothetical protein